MVRNGAIAVAISTLSSTDLEAILVAIALTLCDVKSLRFGIVAIPILRFGQLRLYHQIFEHIHEENASAVIDHVNGLMDSTARTPAVADFVAFIQKRHAQAQDLELWAALRLQRWFRRQQAVRELNAATDILAALDKKEFNNPGTKIKPLPCENPRVLCTLRMLILRWRFLRQLRAKRGERKASSASGDSVLDLRKVLVQLSKEDQHDCAVAQLLRQVEEEDLEEAHLIQQQMRDIVVLNWVEDIADLALVTDRHWQRWATPPIIKRRLQAALSRETLITRMEKSRYGCACVVS